MQPSPLLWITVLIVLVLVLRCPNRKPSTDKFYKIMFFLGKNWNIGGYLRIKLLFETVCWIFMYLLSFSSLVKYWWPPACYSWKSPSRYLTLLKSQEQSNCDINILISISISLWREPVGAFKGISSKLNEVLL